MYVCALISLEVPARCRIKSFLIENRPLRHLRNERNLPLRLIGRGRKIQIARQIKSDWQQRESEREGRQTKEARERKEKLSFNCSDNARCVFHIRIIYQHSLPFRFALFVPPLLLLLLHLLLSLIFPFSTFAAIFNNDRNYCYAYLRCAFLICRQTTLSFLSSFSLLFLCYVLFPLPPPPRQHF